MKRVVLFNVNWLGDVLFSTPAIRALKKTHPDAEITCVVSPRVAELLKTNPYLSRVITLEDRLGPSKLGAMASLVWTLRAGRFDTAVFFSRSRTRAFLAMLAGIGRRVGYAKGARKYFLTDTLAEPAEPKHKTDLFLDLLAVLGVEPDGAAPDFVPETGAGERVKNLLAQKHMEPGEPYAVVHTGGNWALKRWPAEHFSAWIKLLRRKSPLRLVFCGGDGEKLLVEEIIRRADDARSVSICGQTDVSMLALILKGAAFVLSNDSGPIHLAASQSAPIIGLFGPTRAAMTGPRSNGRVSIIESDFGCELPCYFSECRDRKCMAALAPETVMARTAEFL